jgi:hypothetical protein
VRWAAARGTSGRLSLWGPVQDELESVAPYTDYQLVVRHKHGYSMAAMLRTTNSVAPSIFHCPFSLGSYLLNMTPILHVGIKLDFTDVIKN